MFREFFDIFLDELPDVPPERLVDFRIDLVPDATSISKASYCLAPPEIQELLSQLHELLRKTVHQTE